MRKHFLLLFLMALLPLAGWAAQITDDHVTVVNPFYGNVPSYAGTFAANVVVDGYYADQAETTPKTADEVKAANAGTKLYVKFHATGLDGTLTREFTIEQMPLYLVIGKTTPRSKTFGANEPSAADFNGYIETVKDAYNADKKTALQSSIVVGREAGTDVKYVNNVVVGYAYTATLTNQPNYTIFSIDPEGTFKITPKTIEGVTIADIAAVTYKGSAWTPKPEVKDGTTKLTKDVDYTLSYDANTFAHASNPKVIVTGKGNYNTATSANKSFTINPAPLFVTPYAEKEYNYSADVPATPTDLSSAKLQYTFQGFVDAMKASDVTIKQTTPGTADATWASATATKNVGSYPLVFTYGVGQTINDYFTLANYTFIALEGTFKITEKAAAVTAQSYPSFKYGDPENFALSTNLSDVVANDADKTPLGRAIKIEKATTPEASGIHAGEYKLTPKERTDAEIAEVINADAGIAAADKAAAIEAAVIARDNYKVNGTAGYLKINHAPLYIGLKESAYTLNKTYDGEEVSLDLIKSAAGVTVVGLKNNETIDYSKLSLAVDDNDSKVGFYTVRLSGSGIINDNYDITFIPSQFEIKQKTLRVTAYDQVFVVNATIPANLNNLYKIDTTDGLVDGDEASDVFKLAFVDGANGVNCVTTAKVGNATDGVSGTAFSANPLKFTAVPSNAFVHETVNYNTGWAAGVLAGGITFVASDADPTKTKWGNYKVVITKGKVTVIDNATAVILDDTKDLTTVVTDDVDAATVTFSPRNLNAEKWNVLVLPFEVSVKALSNAFGYAVIDVLDESANDGNMHFKLAVNGNIKANTPFMIYPSDDKNNLNQVVFTGVDVKKITSATVEKKDGKNNKIVGTYATTGIYGDKFYYMSKGEWKRAGKYTEASKLDIVPLRAYLDLSENTSSARPTIFIEEPDGNTTAIKTLNVETMTSYSVDGWYTLNGVKLQGMPTEKGIYINNGKKVVIK